MHSLYALITQFQSCLSSSNRNVGKPISNVYLCFNAFQYCRGDQASPYGTFVCVVLYNNGIVLLEIYVCNIPLVGVRYLPLSDHFETRLSTLLRRGRYIDYIVIPSL